MGNKFKQWKNQWDHQDFTKETDEGPWLLNWANILWLIAIVALVGMGLYFQSQSAHYQGLDRTASAKAKALQKKVDKLVARNNTIVYLPKAGDINLSKDQAQSVSFLNQFVSDVTTFDGQPAYNNDYDEAKKAGIKDPEFWNGFMEKPYDKDGTGIVNATNLKLKNIRTQVIVTGKDSYIVVATYIPYHASSDLYQQAKLTTQTYLFDVQGTVGNWTKFQLLKNVNANSQTVTAGELGN